MFGTERQSLGVVSPASISFRWWDPGLQALGFDVPEKTKEGHGLSLVKSKVPISLETINKG